MRPQVTGSVAEAVCRRRPAVAWRVFLKERESDVPGHIQRFADFDPARDDALTIADAELSEIERNARRGATSDDDVELEDEGE